ncbi:MAG TPA: neutral zinc metallopeptidase [Gemmatimonadaceae bacterium]|jgi:predicted metalloprotease|nr:neutral zinc metallopeptidase [Gemmatimonadaceae bacterium]
MTRSRGMFAAFAAVVVASAPVAVQSQQYPVFLVTASASADVTARDVEISNQKIRMAHAALITMWGADFRAIGYRFTPPDIVPYLTGVRSACGIMRQSNALYCPRDNTIYFDEVFVASQAKKAANQLGTDGDMAAVGIVAHEMGHAVAMQLGHVFRDSYENESTADCLAGAFAEHSSKDGSLEDGDIDEAFYAMSTAGDPTPEPTGDPRMDQWILSRLARRAHGTREQRMSNFRRGLDGGAGACLAEFRGIK